VSLTNLYTQMLLDPSITGSPITAEIQRRILAHARTLPDTSLLVELARYRDLDDEIDREIAADTRLEVLAAWTGRPGRRTEDLVERLGAEKRPTLLLPLAQTGGLPDAVYETLAAHRSPKVRCALIANTGVPLEVRVAKLAEYVTAQPRGGFHVTCENLRNLCEGTPEQKRVLYETVAEHSTVLPYLSVCLDQGYTRPEDIDRWIRDLPVIHGADDRWYQYTGSFVERLAGEPLRGEQIRRLTHAAERILENSKVQSWETWDHYVERALTHLRTLDPAFQRMLVELTETTDPERCAELIGILEPSAPANLRRQVIRAAVMNPVSPVGRIHGFRSSMVADELRHYVQRLERESEVGHLHSWLDEQADRQVPPPLLDIARDPAALLTSYREHLDTTGSAWPAWFVHTAVARNNPRLALERLPWKVVSRHAGDIRGMTGFIEARLLEELGADPQRWECFNVLAETFSGTFEDLLGAAVELG